jgi:hypothetical protein
LLSAEDGRGNEKDKAGLLRVRLVETAHGLRLWDGFEPLDATKFAEIVRTVRDKVGAARDKLALPAGHVIPVGIVDVHRAQLDDNHRWLTRVIPGMLSVRLSKEPRIVMLEREDLQILRKETLLTDGEDAQFWSSAILIDGYLRPGRGDDLEMNLQLTRPSSDKIATLTVSVRPDEPSLAVDKVAAVIIRELLDVPPVATWDPKREAEAFFRQGQLLFSHARHEEATAVLETAHALQPRHVSYTGALFNNEWALRGYGRGLGSRPSTITPHYSDLELANLVSKLVRQIRNGCEEGTLKAWDIYNHWGKHLGVGMRGTGYLANSASVSSQQVRMTNRESRTMWADTFGNILQEQWLAEDHPGMNNRIRARLAWISSDDPEVLVANVKRALSEFVMPPESGGKVESPQERSNLYDQAFRHFVPFHLRYLEQTHLAGQVGTFAKLWRKYLAELTTSDDPVVRFNSSVDLAWTSVRDRNAQSAARAKYYALRALKALTHRIKGPDEDYIFYQQRDVKRVKQCLEMLEIKPEERVGIWEQVYEPMIEQADAEKLALWDPGYRAERIAGRGTDSPKATKRYYELIGRIAAVLQTRRGDALINRALANTKDARAGFRRQYPHLVEVATEQTDLAVEMLLAKADWPIPFVPRYHRMDAVMAEVQREMLWITFMSRAMKYSTGPRGPKGYVNIGLAGIDLEKRKLSSLRQTEILFGDVDFGRLTGVAITDRAAYLSSDRAGILVLPGGLVRGRQLLKDQKILSREHGLPSASISSLARSGDRLMVAYGGRDRESGLGLYDPENAGWETIFCSTLKGKTPFSAGKPYEIYSLTPVHPDRVFFMVYDPDYFNKSLKDAMVGLWGMNLSSGELKYHGPIWLYHAGINMQIIGNDLWIMNTSNLIRFDLDSERMSLVMGPADGLLKKYLKKNYGPSEYLQEAFIPPSYQGNIKFGSVMGGFLDLSRAAIHDSRLWARLGRTQITIARKGESVEEARIIENNILDGHAVSRFVSTPYGLVAIGDGVVGLVEDGDE